MSLRTSVIAMTGTAGQADGDKGIKGDKGLKGLAYNVQATRGYAAGFTSPPSLAPTVIDSFPFATPFTTTAISGYLSKARFYAAGQSSSTDGYTSGGAPFAALENTIDSFPFSTPFTTATDVGDLSQGRSIAAGQSSSTDGYTSGGFAPPFVNTIDSFPFSSPFTTATDAGDISQVRGRTAGQNSTSDGYTSGGYINPPLSPRITIDSFPFSTPFTTATDVGDLSQARYGVSGQSSSTTGYSSGGRRAPAPFPDIVATIDSFPFSAPFTTATDVGDLSKGRYTGAGHSGDTEGYTNAGGGLPGRQVIDKFPFSNPFTTATQVGESWVNNAPTISGTQG